MSLLAEMFGGNSNEPAQPSTPTPAPATPDTPPEPEGLDKYKDIWNPIDPKDAPKEFDPTSLHQLDPEKFQEEIKKINFVQGVKAEDVAAIAEGGEAAVAAVGRLVNHAAQQAFAQALLGSTRLVENAVTKTNPLIQSQIDKALRGHEVNKAVNEVDPTFSHPAVAPMIEGLKSQLMVKHPRATPTEIATMAKSMFDDLMRARTPKAETTSSEAKSTDWDEWVSTPVKFS